MQCYSIEILDLSNLTIPDHFINSNGNVTLDLDDGEGLTLKKEVNAINDANQLKIDGVLTIDIPLTPKNSLIFKRWVDTDLLDFNPAPLHCRVMNGSTPLKQRYVIPKFVNDQERKIEILLSFSNDHWALKFSQTKLNEIILDSFTLTRPNVISSWANFDSLNPGNPGYFFPPVHYGGSYSNKGQMSISDARPWINDVVFLKRAFCQAGWTLEGTILSNSQFRYKNSYLNKSTYANNENLDPYRFKAAITSVLPITENTGISYNVVEDMEEILDPSNMFTSGLWYQGKPQINDKIKLFYLVTVLSLSNGDKAYISLEKKTVNAIGAEIIETEKIRIEDTGTYTGTLEMDVSYDEGQPFTIKPRVNIEGQGFFEYLEFYNDPQQYKHVNGDLINVSNELDDTLTVLDFIKGFVHPFLKIYTNEITKTVTIYPPDRLELYDVDEEGYSLNESVIVDLTENDSKISYTPANDIERHQYYQWKSEGDIAFKQNDQLKDALTAKIDLGDTYQNKTKKRANPIFDATILRNTETLFNKGNSTESNNGTYPPVYLPSCASSDGKPNINVSKRTCVFQWCGQRNIDAPSGIAGWNTLVIAETSTSPGISEHKYFPLGYMDLSLHPTIEFTTFTGQPVPFIPGLSLNQIHLYNKFGASHLAEYASPRHTLNLIGSSKLFYDLNFRKRLRGEYNGDSFNLRPISAISDVCGMRTTVTLIGDLKGDDICDIPIIEAPENTTCNNFPKITVTYADPCQNFELTGTFQSVLNTSSIVWEYRYKQSDGTYPDTWTTLANTGLLTSQLCNATGVYQLRVSFGFNDECPNLSEVIEVDPCGNDPQIFFDAYIGSEGTQCWKAYLGGTVGENNSIDTITLFYSINGATPIAYTENTEICLTGADNATEVCITGTITYTGDCEDKDINECFTFPVDNPDCTLTNLQAVCIPDGNGGYTFDTTGIISATAAAVLIQYKFGNDGDIFIWNGQDTVTPPSGEILYVRVIVIFCNNVCPVYCSTWIQCNSGCTATSSISSDCCTITLALSNCTNPSIVWQVADIGASNWSIISNETATTLNTSNHYPNQNKKYRAQIDCDGCGTFYSAVTEFIQSVAITADGCDLTASLTGIACTSNVTYTWQYSTDGGNNWDVVSSGVDLNAITADLDALYRVIVNYGGCTRTSNQLDLQCDLCDDITATIEVSGCCTLQIANISGTNSPSYQWQKLLTSSWADISGETNATLNITENGTYRLCITNTGCEVPVYSNVIIVSYDVEIVENGCDLTASTTGDCETITYNWQKFNTSTSLWEDTGTTTANYTAVEDELFRVVATFGTCITVESDPVSTSGCDPCNPIIVIDNNDCELSILTIAGCVNPLYQWQRLVGSNWTDIAGETGTTHTAQQNDDYRLKVTCDCGEFFSNEVVTTCCDTSLVITMDSCIAYVVSSSNCGFSSSNQWQKSCDGGATWTTFSTAANIVVTDDCLYRLRRVFGCECISNVVQGDCSGNCSGSITKVDGTCQITYTLPCTNGSWGFYKQEGSGFNPIQTGSGTIPTVFNITSDGTYKLIITCNDGCDYESPISIFSGCGSACDSTLTVNVVDCNIIANVTNCPSPTYTFKLNGNTIYTGANNAISVNQDGNYTVEVTGCPDCGTLSTSVQVSGCEPTNTCDCSVSISATNCNQLLATENDCDGYAGTWQRSDNGVSGWVVVGQNVLNFTAPSNGFYRKVKNKNGCPDVVSNIIQITCIATCSPGLSISIINDGCTIRVDWDSCPGLPNFTQWSFASSNSNDTCGGCNGWGVVSGQDTTVANPNGTGYSEFTPNQGSTCYRFILDCCPDGVPPLVACIFWDESGCISTENCIVFNYAQGGVYTMESCIVNGVQYNPASTVMPGTQINFEGTIFNSDLRDRINALNIPNFTASFPTSVQIGTLITHPNFPNDGNQSYSLVLNHPIGDIFTIIYKETQSILTFEFTLTENGTTVHITQNSNGNTIFQGDPDDWIAQTWGFNICGQ